MNKDTNVIFRINSDLKQAATALAKKNGFTLSEVIIAGLSDITKKDFIPVSYHKYLPHHQCEQNIITLSLIKREIENVVNEHGKGLVKKVYLFGSYARGEQKPSSDIDLRIEADDGLSLFDLGNIRLDLVNNFKKDVDLLAVKKEDIDPSFYGKIKKEEICLFEK